MNRLMLLDSAIAFLDYLLQLPQFEQYEAHYQTFNDLHSHIIAAFCPCNNRLINTIRHGNTSVLPIELSTSIAAGTSRFVYHNSVDDVIGRNEKFFSKEQEVGTMKTIRMQSG